MTDKVKKYIGIAILIILFAGGTLYSLGYRFTDHYTLGRLGTISLVVPLQNTSVFIDASQKITTTKDNEEVKIRVSPKTHLVIVSRPGYFPWAKKVTVPSGKKVVLRPIFITQTTTGQIITVNDPEYYKIKKQVETHLLPTKEKPDISSSGDTKLWYENGTVLAETKTGVKTVLTTDKEVRSVTFFKNRDDAVLVSVGESVFVVEVDSEDTQNILPVYKGQNPMFIQTDPNYIYIVDGNNLMSVVI